MGIDNCECSEEVSAQGGFVKIRMCARCATPKADSACTCEQVDTGKGGFTRVFARTCTANHDHDRHDAAPTRRGTMDGNRRFDTRGDDMSNRNYRADASDPANEFRNSWIANADAARRDHAAEARAAKRRADAADENARRNDEFRNPYIERCDKLRADALNDPTEGGTISQGWLDDQARRRGDRS